MSMSRVTWVGEWIFGIGMIGVLVFCICTVAIGMGATLSAEQQQGQISPAVSNLVSGYMSLAIICVLIAIVGGVVWAIGKTVDFFNRRGVKK